MLAPDHVINFPLADIKRPLIKSFFRACHWGQCLELLNQLCRYKIDVVVVVGPSGIGKTSMKYALEKRNIGNLHMIDDAHNLSLDQIESLFQIEREVVLLFAQPELLTRLQKSNLVSELSRRVRVIEIEPLTYKEMCDFLHHQWQIMQNTGSIPFSKKELKKLYTISAGVPGKAKQLFSDALRGSDVLDTDKEKRKLSPFVVGLVVALGIVMCFTAFLWPTSEENFVVQNVALPVNTVITQEPAQVKHKQAATFTASEIEIAQQKVQEEKLEQLERKMLALYQDNSSSIKFEVDSPTETVNIGTEHEQRILARDASHYALQLVAASKEYKIKEFITKHQLDKKAYYYTGEREGKPWYTVVYGDFKTKTAALEAAQILPASIKKLGPWARKYEHIQNNIRNNLSDD